MQAIFAKHSLKMNRRRDAFFFLFMVMLSVLMALLYHMSNEDLIIIYNNSDALYVPALFEDIFFKHGSIDDWYFGAPNYAFPDHFIFAIAHYLGWNLYSRILIFSCIFIIALASVILFLANQITNQNRAFLLSAPVIFLLVWFGASLYTPYMFLFSIGHHYGIILLSIFYIGLWLLYLRRYSEWPRGRGYILLSLFLLAFIGSLSDGLFLIQGVLPLSIVIFSSAILYRVLPIKIGLTLSISISATGALAYQAYPYLVNRYVSYGKDLGLGKVSDNIYQLFLILQNDLSNNPVFALVFFTYLVFLTKALFHTFRTKTLKTEGGLQDDPDLASGHQKPSNKTTTSIIMLYSAVSIIDCFFFSSIMQQQAVVNRYLWPLFVWPILIVLFVSLSFFIKNIQHFLNYFAVFLIILFLLKIFPNMKNGLRTEYYPPEIACLDAGLTEAGLSNGIAGYWDARFLQSWSALELNIAQVTENLEEYRWVTSERYFRDRYDFAVITKDPNRTDRLPIDTIIRINGQPETVKNCGDRTLYIFGKDKLRTKKVASIGDEYTWLACELPSVIGECDSDSKSVHAKWTESGNLTYGPYESLTKGKYGYEIAYSSKDVPSESVGSWDIGSFLTDEPKYLRNGEFTGSGGKKTIIQGHFELTQQYDQEKIEIRTFKKSSHDLNVLYIKLSKLE